VIEQVTPPAWRPPPHIHSCEDEIFYILDGSYELHVGDERRTVSAGASAILPRNIPRLSQGGVHAQPLGIRYHSRRTRGLLLGGGKMFASPQSPTTG
jgi:Cupin domain